MIEEHKKNLEGHVASLSYDRLYQPSLFCNVDFESDFFAH